MHHSLLPGALLSIALASPATNWAMAQAAKPAADEFAVRGQREARAIKYGDWEKVCFKPGGAKMVCRTTIAGHFETGQIAVRVYIVEREDQSTTRLQMFLPVGLYMPAGAKLTVDKGVAHKIPYTWCLTNTCIAGDVANPELLRELENGSNLAVEVVDTNMLAVTTTLPLNQFATVRKGAPIKIFEQSIDE
ncbi:invasion associated locus B family protein [Bradyrhizobium icense]|uniref:Invasion protein B n=1 Tax=Bradyrhizobium icense TaxID=1274631 RepID=A0A1B1UEM6_9BRAD|nr:invasion associated locus B family protein [Bradyrhizobium icense]ANW01185.1 invasion protein B [Bradyrhizobium icense]